MARGIDTITEVLNQWADAGVFAYLLPFLFIFAVVFGILNKTKVLGESKGVQATIALALGLLALMNDYVSNFFALFMPYAGVGIAVLLIGVILMGLMYDDEEHGWMKFVFFGLGVVIFLVVVITSISDSSFIGGSRFAESWPAITAGVVLLLLIAFVVWGGKKSEGKGH
ncbi:MAG: hypothetical protein WCX73_05130 [Candidatus Pacearchaeota archaeon]|jgi:hypothetical protein